MRFSLRFLYGVLCAAFIAPAGANVATTAGSNLTGYNGTGAMNNNQWNNLMNGRGGIGTAPATANFGNCNAVILRCASPKCSGGGCYDMNVARPIVAGCVNANASCKKHGDDLIDYITAQIVAQSNAKQQEQANAVAIAQAQAEAQAQASAAAAAQSNAQMQQMQAQMAEMQAQMAESMAAMQEQMVAQSESQNAQIQSALESQRESMAAATNTGETGAVIAGLEGLGVAEQLAAKNGISADILVREQMGGKIETAIEDAMQSMKDLKNKLDAVLEYAGCDSTATNCTGPKRVKKFKDLANEFFDPYENVVENVYDALMLAMTLGIDVNDVIMLLSDSCNIWGKYMCAACTSKEAADSTSGCVCNDEKNNTGCYYRVATEKDGTGRVSKNQPHCRLVDTLTEKDTVWREWIDANTGMTGSTQVACASDVIMNISLFRGRKKQATLDIDSLRRLVNQDSYSCRGKVEGSTFKLNNNDAIESCGMNMCAVDPNDNSEGYKLLYDTVRQRKLPKVDKTAKSLCWESFDDAPRSVKNIEPTVILSNNFVICGKYGTINCPSTYCRVSGDKCVPIDVNTSPVTEGNVDDLSRFTDKATCIREMTIYYENDKDARDVCNDYFSGKYGNSSVTTNTACGDYDSLIGCSLYGGTSCHWDGTKCSALNKK